MLVFPPRTTCPGFPSNLVCPIFPVITTAPIPLAKYLQTLGYDAQPIPYPAVPRGKERIRIIAHAGNTKKDFDDLVDRLIDWVREYKPEDSPAVPVVEIPMEKLTVSDAALKERTDEILDKGSEMRQPVHTT